MKKYKLTTQSRGMIDEQMKEKIREKCKKYPELAPTILPASILTPGRRILVLGDIHGDYKLAINMLKIGRLIDDNQQWIGGNSIVVQVGDQIDRCRPMGSKTCNNPDTTYKDEGSDINILELFTNLDRQAKLAGGMVISLLGNHELLNAQGVMSYVSKKGLDEFAAKYPNKLGSDARKQAFSPGNEYGTFLGCTRNVAVIIGPYLFVHAGVIDKLIGELQMTSDSAHKGLEKIQEVVKLWLLGLISKKDTISDLNNTSINSLINDNNSIFWTRILGSIPSNTPLDKCSNHIGKVLEIFKVSSIIIGHTPQSFQFNDKINGTCDGAVWRVDNGSSAAFHLFDEHYKQTGEITPSRQPQILEIVNGKFNVLL